MGEQQFHHIGGVELVNELRRGAAYHRTQRMHIHHFVESGGAGFIGNVQVRTLVEKHGGEIEVSVEYGEDEGGGAVGVGRVDVGFRIGESAGRVDARLDGRRRSGSPAARRTIVKTIPLVSHLKGARERTVQPGVRYPAPPSRQGFDDGRVIFGDGVHPGRSDRR